MRANWWDPILWTNFLTPLRCINWFKGSVFPPSYCTLGNTGTASIYELLVRHRCAALAHPVLATCVCPGSQANATSCQRKGNTGHQIQPRLKGDKPVDICRNYNSDRGCNFVQCKFKHKYIVPGCSQGHPATVHSNGKKVDIEVNPLPGLHFSSWKEESGDDIDRKFILRTEFFY